MAVLRAESPDSHPRNDDADQGDGGRLHVSRAQEIN